MVINFNPFANRLELSSILLHPISVLLRACYLYTDMFLMMSSLLVSYSLLGRMQRGQRINILKEVAGRYLRIMPPMAAVIIFATFVLPLLGSGPQWNTIIKYESELCKTTWWRSFLMIHNWFGLENICIMNTHHVGADFELFVAALFFIILIHFLPKAGMITTALCGIASAAARVYITYVKDTTVFISFQLA